MQRMHYVQSRHMYQTGLQDTAATNFSFTYKHHCDSEVQTGILTYNKCRHACLSHFVILSWDIKRTAP